MKIAFYGSSLLSSYWNGAATYYRGLLKALSALGYEITFYEPDILDRRRHRDMEPPDWCEVVVYQATDAGLRAAIAQAAHAEVVVTASGVGFADIACRVRPWQWRGKMRYASGGMSMHRRRLPKSVMMHRIRCAPSFPELDLVLTYGGGDPVIAAYRALGAADCVPIYNALDPATHHPVAADQRYRCRSGVPGQPAAGPRSARRGVPAATGGTSAVAAFPAGRRRLARPSIARPMSSDRPRRHRGAQRLQCHALVRSSTSAAPAWLQQAFPPPTRLFEVAGAGACLITDAWDGIELFLTPDSEVLVAAMAGDVVEIMQALTQSKRQRLVGRGA